MNAQVSLTDAALLPHRVRVWFDPTPEEPDRCTTLAYLSPQRNRMDKWYIWRSERANGPRYEWLLQFPVHRRSWWRETTKPVVITAFNTYADAVAYMRRVESQMGRAS